MNEMNPPCSPAKARPAASWSQISIMEAPFWPLENRNPRNPGMIIMKEDSKA